MRSRYWNVGGARFEGTTVVMSVFEIVDGVRFRFGDVRFEEGRWSDVSVRWEGKGSPQRRSITLWRDVVPAVCGRVEGVEFDVPPYGKIKCVRSPRAVILYGFDEWHAELESGGFGVTTLEHVRARVWGLVRYYEMAREVLIEGDEDEEHLDDMERALRLIGGRLGAARALIDGVLSERLVAALNGV